MQVCTTVADQTAFTASVRPLRPSQTSMSTKATPQFLISVRTRPPVRGTFTGRPARPLSNKGRTVRLVVDA